VTFTSVALAGMSATVSGAGAFGCGGPHLRADLPGARLVELHVEHRAIAPGRAVLQRAFAAVGLPDLHAVEAKRLVIEEEQVVRDGGVDRDPAIGPREHGGRRQQPHAVRR